MTTEAQIKAVEEVIYQGKYKALTNHEIAVWACEVYEAAEWTVFDAEDYDTFPETTKDVIFDTTSGIIEGGIVFEGDSVAAYCFDATIEIDPCTITRWKDK